MPIQNPTYTLVNLGTASKDPGSAGVKPRLVSVDVGGSAIWVASKPTPGVQLILESPSSLPYRLSEGAFIRPGGNFTRFFLRHENADGGSVLLAVYPPTQEDDYPSLLQTQPMERVRGIATARFDEVLGTTWRARLQNTEAVGGKIAYIHSIDFQHNLGSATPIRIRVDMHQDITSGAAGEAANVINWVGSVANVAQSGHFPKVQAITKGAAWPDPPDPPHSAYYLNLQPQDGLAFDPPFPLMPQKEVRVSYLSTPAVTGIMTADLSGDVMPTAGA